MIIRDIIYILKYRSYFLFYLIFYIFYAYFILFYMSLSLNVMDMNNPGKPPRFQLSAAFLVFLFLFILKSNLDQV